MGFIEIGYIYKVHGYKGNVLAKITEPNPDLFHAIDAIFLDVNTPPVPFFCERFTIQKKDQALIHFEDINSEADAKALIGKKLLLPDEVYHKAEIDGPKRFKGWQLILNDGSELGRIEEIEETGSSAFAILFFDDDELFIPIHEDFIVKEDLEQKTLVMNLPEGILNIND